MMENRSFDHLLGWLPGVNGKQAGLSFPGYKGGIGPTAALGSNTQACGDKDPDHTWQGMVKHYNNGKCDGWLKTQFTGDHFPIGYYEEAPGADPRRAGPGLHAFRRLPLLDDGPDLAQPLLPAVRGHGRRRDRPLPARRRQAAVQPRDWRFSTG